MKIHLESEKLKIKSTRSYSGNSIPVGSPLGRILVSSSSSVKIANAIRSSKSDNKSIRVKFSSEDSKSLINKINSHK